MKIICETETLVEDKSTYNVSSNDEVSLEADSQQEYRIPNMKKESQIEGVEETMRTESGMVNSFRSEQNDQTSSIQPSPPNSSNTETQYNCFNDSSSYDHNFHNDVIFNHNGQSVAQVVNDQLCPMEISQNLVPVPDGNAYLDMNGLCNRDTTEEIADIESSNGRYNNNNLISYSNYDQNESSNRAFSNRMIDPNHNFSATVNCNCSWQPNDYPAYQFNNQNLYTWCNNDQIQELHNYIADSSSLYPTQDYNVSRNSAESNNNLETTYRQMEIPVRQVESSSGNVPNTCNPFSSPTADDIINANATLTHTDPVDRESDMAEPTLQDKSDDHTDNAICEPLHSNESSNFPSEPTHEENDNNCESGTNQQLGIDESFQRQRRKERTLFTRVCIIHGEYNCHICSSPISANL